MKSKLIAIALATLGAAPLAQAQQVGQHPAVWAPRTLPAVDVNTFIPGHPASPRTRAGHANHSHPAVAQWRGSTGIDSDHFLVQPPASVQWTLGPGSAPSLAAVPATNARMAVLGG